MCAKCDEIDAKIIRYKRVASQLNDQVLQENLAELISEMLAQKASLHPNEAT